MHTAGNPSCAGTPGQAAALTGPETLMTRPDPNSARTHDRARLDREFDRLQAASPRFGGLLARLRSPGVRLIRIPVAVLLILLGFAGFLPVLGFWMIPLGLLLLAIDIPALQGPVGRAVLRLRHWWTRRRR